MTTNDENRRVAGETEVKSKAQATIVEHRSQTELEKIQVNFNSEGLSWHASSAQPSSYNNNNNILLYGDQTPKWNNNCASFEIEKVGPDANMKSVKSISINKRHNKKPSVDTVFSPP